MSLPDVLATSAQSADPIFALLLEATIKGSVVLAVAALLGLTLHAGSAARRHLLWTVALGTLAVLPLLVAALPRWRVIVPAYAWVPTVASEANDNPLRPAAGLPPSSGATSDRSQPVDSAPQPAAASPGATHPSTLTTESHRVLQQGGAAGPTAARQRSTWRAVAVAVWLVGALAVLGVFVLGHVALRLAARDARPLRDRDWQDAALEAADRLHLVTPFALLQSAACGMPVAFGLLRPRVLLPAGALDWPAARRRSVLLHELAHVQRHDCLTQALAQLVCALYWFHPAVWWAAGRMRAERERACDDRVLAAATSASAYADHLLEVVRSQRDPQRAALGAVAFARASQFEGRLLAVLDPRRDRRAVGTRQAVPTALLAALTLGALAVLQPVAAPTRAVAGTRGPAVTGAAAREGTAPPLIRRADRSGGLEAGMAWAAEVARRQGVTRWWVGWELEPGQGQRGGILSDSDGIDFTELERAQGRLTLDDLLAGRTESTWDADGEPSSGRLAVLVLQSDSPPGGVERVRVQSGRFVISDDASPLFWLGQVADAESIAWMRATAERTQERDLRAELIEDLAYHGSSDLVVPYLREVLQRREPTDVRASAADGLGWHPGPATIELLVQTARTDRSTAVRRRAAEALGRMRSPEAMEQLLALAGDSGSGDDVRRGAFDAIGDELARRQPGTPAEAGAEAHRAQKAAHAADRARQESAMHETGPEGARSGESAPHESEPIETAEFPGAIDPATLEVQMQAVESLGRYPAEQALPRLRSIADGHSSLEVRAQAVEVIGRLEGPQAQAALDEILWKAPHEQVRWRAVEAISRRLPPEEALAKLQMIMRTHPSSETRQMAVEMLGRLDSAHSVTALEEILRTSDDPEMCRRAVETLGRRDDPTVTARLEEIARSHRSLEARRQAAESLSRREPADAARRLLALARADMPEEVQRQAVESLGRLDHDVMPALAELARSHPSPTVRRQAVETMARRDPDQALPLLEEILRAPGGSR